MPSIGMVGVNTSHADKFPRIHNGTGGEAPLVDDCRVTMLWGRDGDARVAALAEITGVMA